MPIWLVKKPHVPFVTHHNTLRQYLSSQEVNFTVEMNLLENVQFIIDYLKSTRYQIGRDTVNSVLPKATNLFCL